MKDVSKIWISGGCEVYAESSITFKPLGKEKAIVNVDNSQRYFYDQNSNPIASFKVEISFEQLSPFFEQWIKLADAIQKKPDYANTRNAAVSFDLVFQDSEVHISWSENDGGYQLDPIIDSIEAFVTTCRKIKAPDRWSSKSSFRPENKTDAFLGDSGEREKSVVQFNDMNGLSGGRIIVVNGMGNVLVQVAAPHETKKIMWQKSYSFDVNPAQLDKIYAAIIKNDPLAIELADRPGIPDETRIHFSITNGKGDFFSLETWEHMPLPPDAYLNSPRAKFDKVCLVLKRLEQIAKTEKRPVQEGPMQTPES